MIKVMDMLRFILFLVVLVVGCSRQSPIHYPNQGARPGAPVQVVVRTREVIPAPAPDAFEPPGAVWNFDTPPVSSDEQCV